MVVPYLRIWIAEQPIIKQECQLVGQNAYRGKVIGNAADRIVRWAEGGVVQSYMSEGTIVLREEEGHRLLDGPYAEQLIVDMAQILKRWRATVTEISDTCRQGASAAQLAQYAELFSEQIMEIFAYFWACTEFICAPIEQRITDLLKWKYPTEAAEKLRAITTPIQPDLLYREKASWLTVRENPTPDRLQAHMVEFPFLFCNIDTEDAAVVLMQQRLREETPEQIHKELQETEKRLANLRVEQEQIFAAVDSAELRRLAALIQQLAWYRLELKDCWSGMHFSLLSFFTEIARRAGAPVRDVMMFYTTGDIVNLAKHGRAVPLEELSARKECYLYLYDRGEILFFSGADAREAKKRYLDPYLPQHAGNTIRGSTANKGTVKGKVRIISFAAKDYNEQVAAFQKGEILVTGMTRPQIVHLCAKAAAIVTDEGGITSHAAVVSREFNIPCIIATHNATKVLRTGDMVEVDANTGAVHKLDSA